MLPKQAVIVHIDLIASVLRSSTHWYAQTNRAAPVLHFAETPISAKAAKAAKANPA